MSESGMSDGPLTKTVEPSADSIFCQHWWLSAVTRNQFDEVRVNRGGQLVGRLPFKATREGPFRVLTMPEFTHVLGPVVSAGNGKPQAEFMRRASIIDELIDQLPPFHGFYQAFDSSIANLPAFQNRGFDVRLQYTFQIDCRRGVEAVWSGMRDKTRNIIRRAEEGYVIVEETAPERFVQFYLANLAKRTVRNSFDFSVFPTLFHECSARQCGQILTACRSDGTPAAMVFLVWDDSVMYYLLSTRAPDLAHNGAVSLLLWRGAQLAHKRGLVFDLDGVLNRGAWHFLSGFGGHLGVRFIVSRADALYRVYGAARGWRNSILSMQRWAR